jgi:exodeoxyribonuclease VII large subunit
VQGEGSAESVADALLLLQAIDDLDAIIVARGGGSIEDLWSFNTEVVARAILNSTVPVISGVGHETDVTICDLVADLRAPTPTAAAELVARGYGELNEKWRYLTNRLTLRIEEKLARAHRRLTQLSPRKSLLRYQDRLQHLRARVQFSRASLNNKIEHRLARYQHRLTQLTEKLAALGPHNVLARGFSILRKENGELVRDFQTVKPGERLEALLESGRLIIEVKEQSDSWW